MISFEQEISGLDFPKAKDRVYELVGRPKVPWEERNVEAIYDYTDANGTVLYQVLRYHGKEFRQRHPDGQGGYAWGLAGAAPVPYRLPKLAGSDFAAICEGEKDCITLERLGLCATCNSGGAGNFKAELAPYFKGKHVAIFPDNDDKGREHALKVAVLLAPVAKSLKIVELPGLELKGDVTDYVVAGGTIEAIRELYRKAQPWSPEWVFGSNVPNENDAWVRTIEQEVEASGGLTQFWNLATLVGIQTPWPKLSYALGGGLRGGEVYVLGANQGSGKTSLALQFTIAAMRRKEGVLYFSMEMGWRSIFQRMASIEARVNLNDLRSAQIELKKSPDSISARESKDGMTILLSRKTADLSALPLLVCTRAAITPNYIVEETARLKKRERISLVVVDHMQLMESSGETKSDYEKFTAISRAMKQVAVGIGVPVMLVSQTNRSQAKEHRGEVDVSDLRGSGSIEEDAAAVLLLYEDADDRKAAKAEGDGSRYTKGPVKSILKIGKNRYGEQGRCFEFQHYKSYTRFDWPSEAV
jgi:KaiC/GvpD/RAD55 family RecA-like ATPase